MSQINTDGNPFGWFFVWLAYTFSGQYYIDKKIFYMDLDGINRSEKLKSYIKEFELDWLPSANVKHEVWQDHDGLTTLCLVDVKGDDCRKLLEPGSKLIYEFYAYSHFDAMTTYYKFMDWGTYTTEFEIDKQPYDKKNTL